MRWVCNILGDILLLFAPVTMRGGGFNIWEGTGCDARVMLTPYLADGENNIAVIVCPGGSYFWHDMETEGAGVAKWLQDNGISAFVLRYRVGTIAGFITHNRLFMRGNRYPDMLHDVQRSIELLREHAGEYGIDRDRIGVMGFSAGGHLAAMSGIFFDTGVLGEAGVKPECSIRPDFVVSVYPVVSFRDACVHKRSRRGALGEGRSITEAMKDSLSLERHVRNDMPPTFLINCADDPVVKCRNSELLDSAMTAAGVEHVYIQYRTGGHGFGATAEKTTPEAIEWKNEFLRWIKTLK